MKNVQNPVKYYIKIYINTKTEKVLHKNLFFKGKPLKKAEKRRIIILYVQNKNLEEESLL